MLPRRPLYALPFPDDVPALVDIVLGRPGAPCDATGLLEAAVYHNVVPFVLRAADAGALLLAADERRRLADRNLARIARTSLLRREAPLLAAPIAAACSEPPIVIKGPALGDRFYENWRDRPYADLDLMVPTPSLAVAVAALEPLGYRVSEELRPGYAERFGHDVHVHRAAGAVGVDAELHWRIGDDAVGIPLDHAHLVRGSVPLELEDKIVLAPSVDDQLLLASVHLLSDRGKRLSWVNDIRLVAESATPDEWNAAFESAHRLGGGLPWVLHRALDYAAHHLGLIRERPLPPGPPPAFGPLRAVEEFDLRASPHVGRLVALRGTERLHYLHAIAVPTRAGLEGTVGGDGAGLPTLLARHARRALRGITRRRE